MLQKEVLIKFQEQLREMVPEVIEDLEDDRIMGEIVDNLFDALAEVVNDYLHERDPGSPTLYYELW